jgi:hypothetical protein
MISPMNATLWFALSNDERGYLFRNAGSDHVADGSTAQIMGLQRLSGREKSRDQCRAPDSAHPSKRPQQAGKTCICRKS